MLLTRSVRTLFALLLFLFLKNLSVSLFLDVLFKLMPRFKVRAEGDLVRMEDQVLIESIKMPSRYLNISSLKFQTGREANCFEVDLSIRQSPLSILPFYAPHDSEANFLKVCSSSFCSFILLSSR